MDRNLANEVTYPNLAEMLRAGAKVVIGENHELGTFAHLVIERRTYTVSSMHYTDIAEVLRQLEWHSAEYIKTYW